MHEHTDECWEPDSGCDMGRNEQFAVAVPRSAIENPTSVIVAAAIRKGRLIFSIPRRARHSDIIFELVDGFGAEAPIGPGQGYEQGFLDADGNFLTREQAARKIGRSGKLFSEDVW